MVCRRRLRVNCSVSALDRRQAIKLAVLHTEIIEVGLGTHRRSCRPHDELVRLELSVSLAHIVKECRRLLGLRAKKRHITIEKAAEHDLPQILADARYSPSRLEPSVERDQIYP